MADLYGDSDVGVAYYRSKDPLRNFKLRIYIQRVTSNMLLNNVDETEGKTSTMPTTNISPKLDSEDRVFQWQEKVFSRREIEFYSVESNCSDVLSKKYHESVCELLEKNKEKPFNRLFTIVEHDQLFSPDETIQPMTTSPNEYITPLAKQMINLRQRKTSNKKPSWKQKLQVMMSLMNEIAKERRGNV